jgi:hypothetical protein
MTRAQRARAFASVRTHTPVLTSLALPALHVEPVARHREAVAESGSRRGAGDGGGEIRPGHFGGTVHVQVVEEACRRRVRVGM